MTNPDVVAELARIVGDAHVLVDADARAPYETDWTGRFSGPTPAVVRPGTADDVVRIIEVCRASGTAIVTQGGNTGLVGGGVPRHGEIVVSLRRFDRVDPVDAVARQITVGAGATIAAVDAAARPAGLRFAVDLAARDSATIGGAIATNAGGLNLIRYGGMRQQVIGIDAVLGTGARITHLEGLVKDNTGYHLPSLLCGSEGTLGIVVGARLALVTEPAHRVVALIGFADIDAAVHAVTHWRAQLDSLEAVEVMVAAGVELVCRSMDLPPPFATVPPVVVLVEAAAHEDPTDQLAAVVGTDAQGEVAVATGPRRRAALWRYREDHTLAINTLGPPHKLDVTLPLTELAAFIRDVPARVADVRPAATTWLFGHLGDGNIHVNVTGVEPGDEAVDEAVLTLVAERRGSISAEHGIGTAKARWLPLNRSAEEIATMRAIKGALDPDGILNPHVLFP